MLENVDEGALRGFSLDILKKKMPEFKKSAYPEAIGRRIVNMVRYDYGLPYMGSGSSRTVYALSVLMWIIPKVFGSIRTIVATERN